MNALDSQTKLLIDLSELGNRFVKKMAELHTAAMQSYLEANQDFLRGIAGVTDVSVLMHLQREFGDAVQTNAQTTLENWGNVIREALENAGDVLREALVVQAPSANAQPRLVKAA